MSRSNFFSGKRILILGGAGFIGSNLATEFVNLEARVQVVDGLIEHTGANVENIKPIRDNIEFLNSPVEKVKNLAEIIEQSDLIIDSMGLTSHNFGMKHPLTDVQLNLLSHLFVIKSLEGTINKKIIYLGSRGQYGRVAEGTVTENTQQAPLDSQGIAKAAAENYYRIYSHRFGFKALSLRITNCFGEKQKVTGPDIGLIGSFIRDILRGNTVEIYGDSARKKNLLYVRDLVKIIVELADSDFCTFDAYNLGGQEVSLKYLLDTIIHYVGKGNYIEKPFPKEIKGIDVGVAKFIDEKLKNRLNALRFTEMDHSIETTINYFRKRIEV